VDEIAEGITEIYHKKVGPESTINVKEVDEIKKDKDVSKPPPIVVSHIKHKQGYKVLEL